MRRQFWFFILCFVLVLPDFAYGQGFVTCGGQGERSCQSCDLVQLVNNVMDWLVAILGTIAAIVIVYAGFKLVIAGGNGHAREDAKEMISNILIGYVIVLAGWLLIDTGMRALVNDETFGVWNDIQCVSQPEVRNVGDYVPPADPGVVQGGGGDGTVVGGNNNDNLGGGSTGGVAGGGGRLVQCAAGNSACSVSALQRAGLTTQQANVMSCIAMTESSGNPRTPPYNIANPGSNSTACGTFQIVGSTWRQYARGACSDHRSSCQNAACNAQVMTALVRANGYQDWTCPNCNSRAASCVRQYSI